MGEEFSIYQKIEDNYSIEDILEILGITVETLLKYYLADEIAEHINDFDICEDDEDYGYDS